MSRGMSLSDLIDYSPLTPSVLSPVVPKEPLPLFPIQYALRLNDGSYYMGIEKGYPWTMDVQRAAIRTNKTVFDATVEAWNKESKDKHKDSAVIGGKAMKNNIHVVDVTKSLRLYVIKIGGCNFYTGSDWAMSIDMAMAWRIKYDAEKIIQKDNMGGWSELLEIPFDRAKFV